MIVVRGLGQGFPQMLLGGLDAAPSGIAMAPSRLAMTSVRECRQAGSI